MGGIFGSGIDCIVFDAPVLGGRVLQDLLLLLLARLKSLKGVSGQLLSAPGVRGVFGQSDAALARRLSVSAAVGR